MRVLITGAEKLGFSIFAVACFISGEYAIQLFDTLDSRQVLKRKLPVSVYNIFCLKLLLGINRSL